MQRQSLQRQLPRLEGARASSRSRTTSAFWLIAGLVACLQGCDSEDTKKDDSPSTTADGGESEKDATTSQPSKDAGSSDGGGSIDASTGSGEALTTTIKIASGPITGEAAQEAGKRVLIFRGVPYAAAPTGALRWKPPQPVAAWTSAREATKWGDRCPQGESTLSSPGAMSEDCLNLNVLTPAAKSDERLPVMVFFHGGGLALGTGNSTTYCHTALPAQGVVVVTVNSRLGAFGYFSHAALATESDKGSSGNYGTLDLIESLRWVKQNITAFGGDPSNVTIFGESGGGSKVLSCMASPLAKGLFHRAVIESGSRSSTPNAVTPRANAEQAGQRVATKLGIAAGADGLAQLRAKTWQEVLAAAAAPDTMFAPNLSIDGWVLPQSVNEAFAQGKQTDVPLIVGANEGEASEFVSSIPALAASMKSVSSKAYVYNFVHLPAGWRTPGCYSFHGLELPYVFGHMDGVKAATILFLGMAARCEVMRDPMVSDVDRSVAANTMKIWSQFAKTGNPSVPGLIDWPAYTAETDQYLEIGAELKVKKGVATSGKSPPPADGGVSDAGGTDAGATD
ncbi:MAG TPA: carboxylesterase family protein, partial [Polyangiales bacterium]